MFIIFPLEKQCFTDLLFRELQFTVLLDAQVDGGFAAFEFIAQPDGIHLFQVVNLDVRRFCPDSGSYLVFYGVRHRIVPGFSVVARDEDGSRRGEENE